MATSATNAPEEVGLLRVLGPAHIWALGVGIVLVGEYMGWNFGVAKGGAFAALMAFNVGLYLVFAYTMLEAGNAITVGYLMDTVAAMTGHSGLDQRPFIILSIMFLAWLNYRGVLATLTFNLVITAFAFSSILILFVVTAPWSDASPMRHAELMTDLPYGWLGVLASMHFR